MKKNISQCPAYNKKRGSSRVFFLYMPCHREKEHISRGMWGTGKEFFCICPTQPDYTFVFRFIRVRRSDNAGMH